MGSLEALIVSGALSTWSTDPVKLQSMIVNLKTGFSGELLFHFHQVIFHFDRFHFFTCRADQMMVMLFAAQFKPFDTILEPNIVDNPLIP